MAKITFEDKVALNPQPNVAEKNKCTDANINEIKASVNDLYDAINGFMTEIWSGTKYTTNDTLSLSEALVSGHLYAFRCKGVSGVVYTTQFCVYNGENILQFAYANVAGGSSEGFRYRLDISQDKKTLTITSDSQNNVANTAIYNVYKVL